MLEMASGIFKYHTTALLLSLLSVVHDGGGHRNNRTRMRGLLFSQSRDS